MRYRDLVDACGARLPHRADGINQGAAGCQTVGRRVSCARTVANGTQDRTPTYRPSVLSENLTTDYTDLTDRRIKKYQCNPYYYPKSSGFFDTISGPRSHKLLCIHALGGRLLQNDSAIKTLTACSHQPVRSDTPRKLPERPTNIRQNHWATKSFLRGLPPPLSVPFGAFWWPFPHFRSFRSPTASRPNLSNVGIATKRHKKSRKGSWTPPACSHQPARADTARNFPERLTDLWQNH